MKIQIQFEDLEQLLRIQDEDGNIWVVKECSDEHNVFLIRTHDDILDDDEKPMESTSLECFSIGCELNTEHPPIYYKIDEQNV